VPANHVFLASCSDLASLVLQLIDNAFTQALVDESANRGRPQTRSQCVDVELTIRKRSGSPTPSPSSRKRQKSYQSPSPSYQTPSPVSSSPARPRRLPAADFTTHPLSPSLPSAISAPPQLDPFREAERRYTRWNHHPPSLKFSPVVPEGSKGRNFPWLDGQRSAHTPGTPSRRVSHGYTVLLDGPKPDVYSSWYVCVHIFPIALLTQLRQGPGDR